MITANRRARATIAFFIPRRLAICIAQALSQDHFFERFGAHILISQEFLALLPGYPHTYPLAEFAGRSRFGAHRRPGEPARYSPSIRRVCSIRISSAMLVCEGEICECAVF
jgi:hypothetical protein